MEPEVVDNRKREDDGGGNTIGNTAEDGSFDVKEKTENADFKGKDELNSVKQTSETKESNFTLLMYQLADTLNDAIWVKIILQAFPIVWTGVIVQAWHSTFYNAQTGNLNAVGRSIAIISAIISVGTMLLTSIKVKKDKKEQISTEDALNTLFWENDLRNTITKVESSIEEERNRHFSNNIFDTNPDTSVKSFVKDAMDPFERISITLDGLKECFSNVSDLRTQEFTLSGAITVINTNSNEKPVWEWATKPGVTGAASLYELMKYNSSFKIVANGNPFYYANDKFKAAKEDKYYLDGRDKSFGSGSIICTEVDEEIDRWRIRLIISISTYGKKIMTDDNLEHKADIKFAYEDRFRDMILKQFEGELKEDLLWYGIQKIDFSRAYNKRVEQYKKKIERQKINDVTITMQ